VLAVVLACGTNKGANMGDFLYEYFGPICIAVLLLIFGWLLFAIYLDAQSPVFELRKDEWTCKQTAQETRLTPMVVGKTTILMPSTSTVCVNYQRNSVAE
jgi:hypothetical protein